MADFSGMSLSNFAELVRQPDVSSFSLVGDEREPRVEVELPFRQLSVFVRRYETSEPLEGLPLYAIASLGDLDAVSQPLPVEPGAGEDASAGFAPVPLVHRPLGLLGADHVGYASFDLNVLRTEEMVTALRRRGIVVQGRRTRVGLRHLWVLPFADPLLIVDALVQGDIGPDVVALRLELDERRLQGRVLGRPMAAMQNPGILDWRMSPGSFSLNGSLLVGEDGCETLLPSNLATQRFRFAQVARVAGKTWERREVTEHRDPNGRVTQNVWLENYQLGHVFEYTTEWFAVGHSLGQLAYSLPLAPGEIIKLAVLDWSRTDGATRTEDTSLAESVRHEQLRDRTLTESVRAVIDEWQRGGTFMGGVAGSAGYGGGGMGMGAAASLGGGYTTSSGTRDLTADTTQRIADAFHQATSALRELRSTVVVQSDQAEAAEARTRVVANYNHSHALTLLYYEVLRHYRVVTRLAQVRPAILVKTSRTNFKDEGTLLACRRELEAALLRPSAGPLFRRPRPGAGRAGGPHGRRGRSQGRRPRRCAHRAPGHHLHDGIGGNRRGPLRGAALHERHERPGGADRDE